MLVSKEYTTEVPGHLTDLSEAFGVVDSFTNVSINLDIPDTAQIIYITGESGAGKTTILREAFGYSPEKENFDTGLAIVELFGSFEDGLQWLSSVGLSDASLYHLTYEQLSDSQKARLGYAIKASREDLVIIDEFLATLDRKTAQAVAFTFQRMIRKLGKKAVVCTSHSDLEGYLRPDLVITGEAYPSRFTVEAKSYPDSGFAVDIRPITPEQYRNDTLGELHYRGKYTGGVKDILGAFIGPKMVGVLLATSKISDPEARRISRLVVHPSYRGCGIGKQLVKAYLATGQDIDVVAVMAKYNPVFERAGMTRVSDVTIKPPPKLVATMKKHGLDVSRWHIPSHCSHVVSALEARDDLAGYARYARKLVQPGGKKLSDEDIAEKLRCDTVTAARVLYQFRPKSYAKYVA